MKFLDLTDLDNVNRDLNFVSSDCRVVGGCELYTTKATGSDRRLLKVINNDLESRFESDARVSASLSPPCPSDLLSRASPFGPLDQRSSRRTYAYLLATLNASHPDYEFSSIVRPEHFRKERSLGSVMTRIDSALFNLRKILPQMWDTIDREMDLKNCTVYSYDPANIEDPYFNDGLLWRFMYFFFNKHRKRVCYLHIRAISKSGQLHDVRSPEGRDIKGIIDEDDDDDNIDEDIADDESITFWDSQSNDSMTYGDDNNNVDFVETMEL